MPWRFILRVARIAQSALYIGPKQTSLSLVRTSPPDGSPNEMRDCGTSDERDKFAPPHCRTQAHPRVKPTHL
jgi:hypothetical protein